MVPDSRNEQILRLTALIAELTQENEKLREEIKRLSPAEIRGPVVSSFSPAPTRATSPHASLEDVLGFPKEGR